PAAATAADIAAGRAILEANCARCHAVGLTGESPLAKAPAFRTLKKRYPIESLAEALAEGIVTGHPGMPQFTFSPSEIDAI
ncbi:cytochrome c, partial [Acinetobacter baumannii]